MFEAEALSLDTHFGHRDNEGPVAFVLKALVAAQRYGALSVHDIKAFLAAMSFVQTSTNAGEFTNDGLAFKRCWATLKQERHGEGDFVTEDIRSYLLSELRAYSLGQLSREQVGLHHEDLTRRLREYEFASLERQASKLGLRLYEDTLIHVALNNVIVRKKINQVVTGYGDSLRRRALAIHAESEARTHFNEWKPLRLYMQYKLPAVLEASL